jgi:hypothetical protein
MSFFGPIKPSQAKWAPDAETNASRKVRPIWVKVRELQGVGGGIIKSVGSALSPDAPPETFGHYALQIGNTAFELATDRKNQKLIFVNRLTGSQIWPSTIKEFLYGGTNMTDQQITDAGRLIRAMVTHMLNIFVQLSGLRQK